MERLKLRLRLGPYRERVERRLARWQAEGFAARLWRKDPALWTEARDRLGWLELPEANFSEFEAFAAETQAEGVRQVVLLGMGGSSLGPEVFFKTFGNAPDRPSLRVLDSTHPDAVRGALARLDLSRTLFLVSSKSGTTIETLALFRFFWAQVGRLTPQPGKRFAAITDPGTPLATLARARGFRRVFFAPADVGGRYSALSAFGLVPAALIGLDLSRLLDRARALARACAPAVPAADNPALALGAALGELARAGRDKLTFLSSPALEAFPDWLEQLLAESMGKAGRGLVPVVREPAGDPGLYGADRAFVRLKLGEERPGPAGHPLIEIALSDPLDLGGEIFRWELAVAAAGAVLGVNPFDQPDVELAKRLARRAMEGDLQAQEVPSLGADKLPAWLDSARHRGGYLALQAYLAPTPETARALEKLRGLVRDRYALATTLGYGPRFLHSTGQLHKGGPAGIFLQLIDEPGPDLAVPETEYTFRALLEAQARGDYEALRRRGRPVARVRLGRDVPAALAALAEEF